MANKSHLERNSPALFAFGQVFLFIGLSKGYLAANIVEPLYYPLAVFARWRHRYGVLESYVEFCQSL